jgi:hypothetical protein
LVSFGAALIEIASRRQQIRPTLLDWLRVEYAIEKPSNNYTYEPCEDVDPMPDYEIVLTD